MRIIGFQKITLLDFPEKVACILFSGGCNFRCPYCHNGELVLRSNEFPPYSESEIFSYLDKRKGVLDGVVISGGEPTLDPDLIPFISRIKEKGLLVKLDTNGTRPDILKTLIENNQVDYIAMDVKNSLSDYGKTIGIPAFDTAKIEESIALLKGGKCPYEFRTTVTKELHKEKNFIELAYLLKGASSYYIQNFVANENTIEKNNSPLSREDIENYIKILKTSIENVQVRNF